MSSRRLLSRLAWLALASAPVIGSAQVADTSRWTESRREAWLASRIRDTTLSNPGTRRDTAARRDSSARRDTMPGARGDSASAARDAARRLRARNTLVTASSAKALADHSKGFRIIISLDDRKLWVVHGPDTLVSTTVAVAMGTQLKYAGRAWTFQTPRGVRTVLRKRLEPVWTPPDWLYAETAKEHGLKLAYLPADHPTTLQDGSQLMIRDSLAGVMIPGDPRFYRLPTDEHIVFDGTLFVPPMGTKNRKVQGELGHYGLELGDGYLLHGTPYQDSIGLAATHGCIRLRDEAIEWLYEHVPVGTKVYIY